MKANKHLFMRKDTSAQVGIGTLIIFIAMVLVAAVAAAVLIQTSGVLQQKAQTTGKQTTQEISSNIQVKSVEGLRAMNDSNNISSTVDLLKLKVGLNVGSSDVDMNQIVVTITDGSTTNDLVYANNDKSYGSSMHLFSTSSASVNMKELLNGTTTGAGDNVKKFFTLEKIRDEDESFSQSEPVMNTGDLVTMYIGTTNSAAVGYDSLHTLADTFNSSSSTATNLADSGLELVPRTQVQILLTPEAGATTTADFVTPSTYGVKETVSLYP